MTKKNVIYLTCKRVIFYSQLDEEKFFEWLQSIKAIIRVDGVGDKLYLYCKNKTISDEDLREIIALFYRYKVDMKQLAIFLNNKNKTWFLGSPRGYWHRKVFGVKNEK